MPVKRRQPKVRARLPEPVQAMLDGQPVEQTPENARELECALAESEYFGGATLPAETIGDIRRWLEGWRRATDPRLASRGG